MEILGKRINHNERLEYEQKEWLLEQCEKLVSELKQSEKYVDVYLEKSKQSEAIYITVAMEYDDMLEEPVFSFRNHDNVSESNYSKAIFISQFTDWNECLEWFYRQLEDEIKEIEEYYS